MLLSFFMGDNMVESGLRKYSKSTQNDENYEFLI